MSFGERLATARTLSGLSLEDAAAKAGVRASELSAWEKGSGEPEAPVLERLIPVIQTSAEYLFDEEGTLSPHTEWQAIDFYSYKPTPKCEYQYDCVVVSFFPHAERIEMLEREKKLSKMEHLLEWTVMPRFGWFAIADKLAVPDVYYIAEGQNRQFLVALTQERIAYTEFAKPVTKKKFTIGRNKFSRYGINLA